MTLRKEPAGQFRKYRVKGGKRCVWALEMPEDFKIEVDEGTTDQRKAGAKQRVRYIRTLEGKAGDFLVISDLSTGKRHPLPRSGFLKAFDLDDS